MNELKPLDLHKISRASWRRMSGRYKAAVLAAALVVLGLLWWFGGSNNSSVVSFVLRSGSALQVENGQVNVLLLGIAGENHEGPNLTDTIMVASYDTRSHRADLISLPRDLWVDQYKNKVNSLYEIGLARGDGLGLARGEIGRMLGINIPYAVRVDFGGFVKAVDLVGGLDLDVARSFDDYAYPVPGKEDDLCGGKVTEQEISEEQSQTLGVEPGTLKVLLDPQGKIATAAGSPGADLAFSDQQVIDFFPCRFEHLSFTQGMTHMDGATALKFVRSRHGNNGEGSDFARSRRQQQVLQTFKGQVLSLGTLGDLSKVTGLIQTLGSSIDSNIPVGLYPEFAKLVKQADKTENFVIDTSGDNPLLITPPPGTYGAWVLIPPNNDFTRIHQYIDDILAGKLEASSSARQK